MLSKDERSGVVGWYLSGDVTASLQALAMTLHEANAVKLWRNEQLAVIDDAGHRVGTVERALVRLLGIATHAVHLLGQAPDGRHWVQQRAWNKATDPGLWDTLVGGMIPAAETRETALERETWEEAGLRVAELNQLRYGGQVQTSLPEGQGREAGYIVEQIDWYRCVVPQGLKPVNQDGEVEQFALLEEEALLESLRRHDFTPEAALLLAELAQRS